MGPRLFSRGKNVESVMPLMEFYTLRDRSRVYRPRIEPARIGGTSGRLKSVRGLTGRARAGDYRRDELAPNRAKTERPHGPVGRRWRGRSRCVRTSGGLSP